MTPNSVAYRQKRIALFTGNYNHIADGVSLTLNRLVNHLETHKSRVMVFGPTVDDPPVRHAGRFVPVPSMSLPGRKEYRLSLLFPAPIQRLLRSFNPDIVHVATPDILGNSALRFARRNELPVVASYHTHFSSYLQYYGLNVLESSLWAYLRRFYSQCSQIYVPSESMADVLRRNGIRDGLRLWQRGVDTRRFHPDKRSQEWRASQGIAPDEVVITFVSRIVLEKGLDVYASVVERLLQEGVKHRSLIVGEGPARAEMMERLPDTIFAGYLGGEDLAAAYASSDLFLFPSETETFGNVTLEAMSSGVPSICADATGSRGLVIHGETGYLAESKNVDQFFTYTRRMIEDQDLRTKMSRQAVERAQEYDWDAILNRIDGYYDEVLELHHRERKLRMLATSWT